MDSDMAGILKKGIVIDAIKQVRVGGWRWSQSPPQPLPRRGGRCHRSTRGCPRLACHATLHADPPQRPHPFAATTFFIDQGIKLLCCAASQKSQSARILPEFYSCCYICTPLPHFEVN
eukprot:SAG25_NODE_1105_length_3953_cov_5.576803_2_plen_118_part_00